VQIFNVFTVTNAKTTVFSTWACVTMFEFTA